MELERAYTTKGKRETHEVLVGLMICAWSTLSTDTLTMCCAIACTTGYRRMNRIAIPRSAPTMLVMMNHLLL